MCPLIFLLILLSFSNFCLAQTEAEDLSKAEKLLEQVKNKPKDESAEQNALSAINLFEKYKQWDKSIDSKKQLARVYMKTQQFKTAETTYLSLLEEIPSRDLEDHFILEAKINRSLGYIYFHKLYLNSKGESCLKESLRLYKENNLGESQDIIGIYIDLGMAYLFNMYAYQQALDHFMKALTINTKLTSSNDPSNAGIYNKIATTHRYQGNPNKAVTYFNKVLAITEKKPAKNASVLQSTYNNLGATNMDLGTFSKAIEFFKKSIEVQKNMVYQPIIILLFLK